MEAEKCKAFEVCLEAQASNSTNCVIRKDSFFRVSNKPSLSLSVIILRVFTVNNKRLLPLSVNSLHRVILVKTVLQIT